MPFCFLSSLTLKRICLVVSVIISTSSYCMYIYSLLFFIVFIDTRLVITDLIFSCAYHTLYWSIFATFQSFMANSTTSHIYRSRSYLPDLFYHFNRSTKSKAFGTKLLYFTFVAYYNNNSESFFIVSFLLLFKPLFIYELLRYRFENYLSQRFNLSF